MANVANTSDILYVMKMEEGATTELLNEAKKKKRRKKQRASLGSSHESMSSWPSERTAGQEHACVLLPQQRREASSWPIVAGAGRDW